MTKPQHRNNEVGPWAEEKLTLLQNYLQAYNTALKHQSFRRVYIDGFAGSPISRIREATPAADALGAFLGDDEAAKDQERFDTRLAPKGTRVQPRISLPSVLRPRPEPRREPQALTEKYGDASR